MRRIKTVASLLAIILALVSATGAQAQSVDAFTVPSVIVDKTAANAVVAREEAMNDARRAAFRKLAERYMTPQAAMDLPLPDDKTLATLVQDLEIKRERLSSTRYVGDFTVRFRDGVRQYIPVTTVPNEMPGDALALDPSGEAISPALGAMAQTASGGRVLLTSPVLLLPYLQDISGQMILWGEPNPWRQLWQNRPPKAATVVGAAESKAAEGKVIVPLGDISDISAGPDGGVWSGDYSAIEKLRAHYNVDSVIVAVANRSGMQMTVDLYSYQSGGLTRRGQLRPVLDPALDDAAAYGVAADMVLRDILTTQPLAGARGAQADDVVAAVSQDLTGGAGVAPMQPGYTVSVASPVAPPVVPMHAGPGARIPAAMQFADFMTWMETQKRLADIVPQVRVDIQSISRNHARFTLGFDGDVNTLTAVLAEKGLRLSQAGAADYQLSLVQ